MINTIAIKHLSYFTLHILQLTCHTQNEEQDHKRSIFIVEAEE